MGQLPLELGFAPRYGADDFLVDASNADAYDTIVRWPEWSDRVTVLVGPEGSGKTHLASIWSEAAGAQTWQGDRLREASPTDVAQSNVVIDDADRVGGAEATLFHVLNIAREGRCFLLLTARQAPDQWRLQVPDLLSRLRLAPLLQLEAPSDDLIRAVLVKLLLDRQLLVDQAVVDFAAIRIHRSLGRVRRLVEALDRTSLANNRRITRPVVTEVLAEILDVDD